MLYLVNINHAGMAMRFKLDMPMSGWMKLYRDMNHWSLTSLDLKRR